MKTESLVIMLKAIKVIQGCNTKTLAAEIGVSERLIPMLYRGERGIGIEFLGSIGRRFPALKEEIWQALLSQPEGLTLSQGHREIIRGRIVGERKRPDLVIEP